jgi:hypothetical protein
VFIRPNAGAHSQEDDFDSEIRRLKHEAELQAQDPAHNPYLLLPEKRLEQLERTAPI